MKRLLLLFMLPLFMLACKSSAPTTNLAPKSDRSTQSEIKGNWQITSVNYPGAEYFKLNSFQIADSKCFVGSEWSFISNNNKGSMRLNSGNCPAFTSEIVWSIDKDGKFGLKFIDSGIKSKNVTQGYLLRIANQTESSFQLIDLVNIGGQNKEVIYQFEKLLQ